MDFSCCGVSFPGDWSTSAWSRHSTQRRNHVPPSCCGFEVGSMTCHVDDLAEVQQGCVAALQQSARNNAGALGAVACVVAAGQILLVVAACKLMAGVRRKDSCKPCY